jgi:DNA primase
LSNDQRQLLAHILTKYPAAAVLAATDSDEQGDRYAVTIAEIRPDAIRAKSPKGKDWNDVVRPAPRKDRHRPFDPATVQP